MASQRTTVLFNLSMRPETKERLKALARANHKTASQYITDLIWSQSLPGEENEKGES